MKKSAFSFTALGLFAGSLLLLFLGGFFPFADYGAGQKMVFLFMWHATAGSIDIFIPVFVTLIVADLAVIFLFFSEKFSRLNLFIVSACSVLMLYAFIAMCYSAGLLDDGGSFLIKPAAGFYLTLFAFLLDVAALILMIIDFFKKVSDSGQPKPKAARRNVASPVDYSQAFVVPARTFESPAPQPSWVSPAAAVPQMPQAPQQAAPADEKGASVFSGDEKKKAADTLKMLLDSGIITQDVYEEKLKEIDAKE